MKKVVINVVIADKVSQQLLKKKNK